MPSFECLLTTIIIQRNLQVRQQNRENFFLFCTLFLIKKRAASGSLFVLSDQVLCFCLLVKVTNPPPSGRCPRFRPFSGMRRALIAPADDRGSVLSKTDDTVRAGRNDREIFPRRDRFKLLHSTESRTESKQTAPINFSTKKERQDSCKSCLSCIICFLFNRF